MDDLIAGLKKRDMKLMMDLVVNHTSDQVSWRVSHSHVVFNKASSMHGSLIQGRRKTENTVTGTTGTRARKTRTAIESLLTTGL